MADAEVKDSFWAEATLTAVHISNRLYHSEIEDIPYRVLYGRVPNYKYLRVFGQFAYVYIPACFRKKGEPKSKRLRFLGYSGNSYKFHLGGKEVQYSRSANFERHAGWDKLHANKEVFLRLGNSNEPETQTEPTSGNGGVSVKPEASTSSSDSSSDNETQSRPITTRMTEDKRFSHRTITPSTESEDERGRSAEFIPRRSHRVRKPPDRFVVTNARACLAVEEPESFEELESLSREEQERWIDAMDDEFGCLVNKDVFEVVDRPKDKKVIGCKWVYKKKEMPDGSIKYKARLVAKGFAQQQYENYDKTYSPTAKPESLRMVLAVAAKRNLVVEHFDFETAYLNASLDEEIFMEQPQGFEEIGSQKVYKLKKALYGLKQSARAWNLCINDELVKLGYKRSVADACVYTKGDIVLVIYVDDLCVAAKSRQEIESVKKELSKKFVLKDLGLLKSYLGIGVEWTEEGHCLLSQRKKIENLIEKCGLQNAKIVRAPMTTGFVSEKTTRDFEDKTLFRSIIGSLQFISCHTRPDISYAVNVLSRRVNDPKIEDWTAVKHLLRYLKGTLDKKLIIRNSHSDLDCYVDSSFASELGDKKSVTGIIIKYSESPIVWRSRKQTNVAISTTEAEFAALNEIVNEVQWVEQLLNDLNESYKIPVEILEDSQSCIAMAETESLKNRTKYVGVRYQNVRDMVQKGKIELRYIETQHNIADLFTKALTAEKHERLTQMVGMTL